jgi:hypothetical protein
MVGGLGGDGDGGAEGIEVLFGIHQSKFSCWWTFSSDLGGGSEHYTCRRLLKCPVLQWCRAWAYIFILPL